jgi:hypothetical protein
MIYIKAERIHIAHQTVGQLMPYFKSHPRFWAALHIFKLNGDNPEDLDEKLIEKEEKYLRDMYRLAEK